MTYTLITRVNSTKDPDVIYDIKTDGTRLTCPCGRWRFSKGTKTCHHMQAVQPTVDAMGGIPAVLAFLRTTGRTGQGLPGAAERSSPSGRPRRPVGQLPVGACDVACGMEFFGGADYCRHGRTVDEGLASRRPAPVAVPDVPDWLGGDRLLTIKD